MPEDDLTLLLEAAEAAGRIALRHWRHDPKFWEKEAGAGPVSVADLAVNEALMATLRGVRPTYGWLSEETPDDAARLNHEQVFVIDPIDGTRSFLAGEDSFALSLAVATAGVVTAAVVHLPARNTTYAAALGGPARKNGAPIQASARNDLTGADVLTTRTNLLPEQWPGGLPDIRRSFRASLAWRMCLAAEGRHDAMLTLRDTWEWDSAAGSLIAQAAGCRVTDRLSQPLRFNQPHPQAPGVVCAPPALHDGFLRGLGVAAVS